MAQRVVTLLIDDIDGKEIADGSGETVSFALDGTSYEIDLNAKNAVKLRAALETYIAAGRKVSRRQTTRSTTTRGSQTPAAEIRQWAQANGHEVPDRGRIPASVREAFEASQ